jgi:hypothetical protein
VLFVQKITLGFSTLLCLIFLIDIFYPTGADSTYPQSHYKVFVEALVRSGRLVVVHYRPDLTNQPSWATASPLQ